MFLYPADIMTAWAGKGMAMPVWWSCLLRFVFLPAGSILSHNAFGLFTLAWCMHLLFPTWSFIFFLFFPLCPCHLVLLGCLMLLLGETCIYDGMLNVFWVKASKHSLNLLPQTPTRLCGSVWAARQPERSSAPSRLLASTTTAHVCCVALPRVR